MGADESSLQELDDSPEASARRAVASGSVDAASLVASEHARVQTKAHDRRRKWKIAKQAGRPTFKREAVARRFLPGFYTTTGVAHDIAASILLDKLARVVVTKGNNRTTEVGRVNFVDGHFTLHPVGTSAVPFLFSPLRCIFQVQITELEGASGADEEWVCGHCFLDRAIAEPRPTLNRPGCAACCYWEPASKLSKSLQSYILSHLASSCLLRREAVERIYAEEAPRRRAREERAFNRLQPHSQAQASAAYSVYLGDKDGEEETEDSFEQWDGAALPDAVDLDSVAALSKVSFAQLDASTLLQVYCIFASTTMDHHARIVFSDSEGGPLPLLCAVLASALQLTPPYNVAALEWGLQALHTTWTFGVEPSEQRTAAEAASAPTKASDGRIMGQSPANTLAYIPWGCKLWDLLAACKRCATYFQRDDLLHEIHYLRTRMVSSLQNRVIQIVVDRSRAERMRSDRERVRREALRSIPWRLALVTAVRTSADESGDSFGSVELIFAVPLTGYDMESWPLLGEGALPWRLGPHMHVPTLASASALRRQLAMMAPTPTEGLRLDDRGTLHVAGKAFIETKARSKAEFANEAQFVEAPELETTNIVNVASGQYHTIAVTGWGGLMTAGMGRSGQLGRPAGRLWENVRIPQLPSPIRKVKLVAAGLFHSLAVTTMGELYTWGGGSNGKLGHGLDKFGAHGVDEHLPKHVKRLADLHVTAIAAGDRHSIALVEDGNVFTWGNGEGGQLGHGDCENCWIPVCVQFFRFRRNRVLKIAAGTRMTAVITTDHKVFTWGDSTYGELGHGLTGLKGRISSPMIITALAKRRVVDIAASTHCLAVARDGTVYAWGRNDSCQLGLGDKLVRANPTPVAPFGEANVYGDDRIEAKRVCCSQQHSLVSDSRFRLWGWGVGRSGQLGNASLHTQSAPVLVPSLVPGVKVLSASAFHTYAVIARPVSSAREAFAGVADMYYWLCGSCSSSPAQSLNGPKQQCDACDMLTAAVDGRIKQSRATSEQQATKEHIDARLIDEYTSSLYLDASKPRGATVMNGDPAVALPKHDPFPISQHGYHHAVAETVLSREGGNTTHNEAARLSTLDAVRIKSLSVWRQCLPCLKGVKAVESAGSTSSADDPDFAGGTHVNFNSFHHVSGSGAALVPADFLKDIPYSTIENWRVGLREHLETDGLVMWLKCGLRPDNAKEEVQCSVDLASLQHAFATSESVPMVQQFSGASALTVTPHDVTGVRISRARGIDLNVVLATYFPAEVQSKAAKEVLRDVFDVSKPYTAISVSPVILAEKQMCQIADDQYTALVFVALLRKSRDGIGLFDNVPSAVTLADEGDALEGELMSHGQLLRATWRFDALSLQLYRVDDTAGDSRINLTNVVAHADADGLIPRSKDVADSATWIETKLDRMFSLSTQNPKNGRVAHHSFRCTDDACSKMWARAIRHALHLWFALSNDPKEASKFSRMQKILRGSLPESRRFGGVKGGHLSIGEHSLLQPPRTLTVVLSIRRRTSFAGKRCVILFCRDFIGKGSKGWSLEIDCTRGRSDALKLTADGEGYVAYSLQYSSKMENDRNRRDRRAIDFDHATLRAFVTMQKYVKRWRMKKTRGIAVGARAAQKGGVKTRSSIFSLQRKIGNSRGRGEVVNPDTLVYTLRFRWAQSGPEEENVSWRHIFLADPNDTSVPLLPPDGEEPKRIFEVNDDVIALYRNPELQRWKLATVVRRKGVRRTTLEQTRFDRTVENGTIAPRPKRLPLHLLPEPLSVDTFYPSDSFVNIAVVFEAGRVSIFRKGVRLLPLHFSGSRISDERLGEIAHARKDEPKVRLATTISKPDHCEHLLGAARLTRPQRAVLDSPSYAEAPSHAENVVNEFVELDPAFESRHREVQDELFGPDWPRIVMATTPKISNRLSLNAQVRNVRVYDRALSAMEIACLATRDHRPSAEDESTFLVGQQVVVRRGHAWGRVHYIVRVGKKGGRMRSESSEKSHLRIGIALEKRVTSAVWRTYGDESKQHEAFSELNFEDRVAVRNLAASHFLFLPEDALQLVGECLQERSSAASSLQNTYRRHAKHSKFALATEIKAQQVKAAQERATLMARRRDAGFSRVILK